MSADELTEEESSDEKVSSDEESSDESVTIVSQSDMYKLTVLAATSILYGERRIYM